MPVYTVETAYHLPVFRQRTFQAPSIEQACHLAIEDDGWDDAKEDCDSAGETYVSGVWEGADAAYRGAPLPHPTQFDESVRRRSAHFDSMLMLLKRERHFIREMKRYLEAIHETGTVQYQQCLLRESEIEPAIAKAEAILAGASDPDPAPAACAQPPAPAHPLDTDTKFYVSTETAIGQTSASIDVHALAEGRVEFVCEQSSRKWNGKRWHTQMVTLTLTAPQVAKLKEALA